MGKLTFHLIKKLTGVDIQQLQEDNDTLLIKNQQLAIDIKDANKEVAYKRTQLTETQNELSTAQKEITTLQESISSLQKDISKLQEEISILQSAKEDSLNKLQSSAEEALSQENLVNQLNNQLNGAEEQINALTLQKAELEKKLDESADKEKEIRQQIEIFSAHNHQLEEAKQALEDKVAELSSENASLKEEKNAFVQTTDESETEIQKLVESLTALQQEYDSMKQAHQTLLDSQTHWQQEKEELEHTVQQLIQKNGNLEHNLEDVREQDDELKETNRQLQSALSAQQATIEATSDDKQALIQEISELQKRNARLEEENNNLQYKIEELENRADSTQPISENGKVPEETEDENIPEMELSPADDTDTSGKETDSSQTETEQIGEESKADDATPMPDETEADKESVTPNGTGETEKTKNEPEDILHAYQDMKMKLEQSTLHYPYTRITTEPDGSQFIFESKTLQLKAELFIWGVEGKEVILDDTHFIAYDKIADIEGMETPFSTEVMECDFSDEGNATEVAETLLMAICSYRPIQITYRDKNGRISNRNLYWISFLPQNGKRIRLPHEGIFRDMFTSDIDPDHIIAMCAHYPDPRIFVINQIQTIRIFEAFVTTAEGINAQIDGLYSALLVEQPEAAEMIYQCIPDKFRRLPAVIANRAHYEVVTGNYEEAMKLYLSINPKTRIADNLTWETANANDFDDLIGHDIAAEAFTQLKEALREEGWDI
ncbi:hypothetical protein [uncultured Bacteroides sp.]|uniref:hypothetical protein n=1 Tax=uncultured Bacteroides sp. TaxID=162156 RepID=UPI002622C139|nr:hypothetical protein [uncultured Bacteroides sp.]